MRSLARIAICLLFLFALTIGAAIAADSLDVPYLSQFWAATATLPASQRNGNCAPAAVEMCAAYAQNRKATPGNIVELNKLMGRKDPIKGGPTKHQEVCDAGKKLYKLRIEYKRIGLADALKEVAAGGPVVVGILYKDISTRWDQNCTSGHMLVLVGADEKSIIVNDPDDKRPNDKGKNLHYDRAEFEKAMNDFGRRCLVGFRKQPTPSAPPAPVIEGPG